MMNRRWIDSNNRWGINKIDYVIIENQIGPLAIRMKTIQGMIVQYFIMSNLNVEHITETIELMKLEYINLPNKSHDIFRNYSEIIRNENYIKPEIIECIYLDTGHCIAIKKTFLIRIIQRSWRNILKKREQIIIWLSLRVKL